MSASWGPRCLWKQGRGGRTRWNRAIRHFPKTHWIDAACTGASTPEKLQVAQVVPLLIQAMGQQRRQMCLVDRYGFPRTKAKQQSVVQGFRTGDLVRVVIPVGKKRGSYRGRVVVRATGSFNLTTAFGTIQGIPAKYCQRLQRRDGYQYKKGARLPPDLLK